MKAQRDVKPSSSNEQVHPFVLELHHTKSNMLPRETATKKARSIVMWFGCVYCGFFITRQTIVLECMVAVAIITTQGEKPNFQETLVGSRSAMQFAVSGKSYNQKLQTQERLFSYSGRLGLKWFEKASSDFSALHPIARLAAAALAQWYKPISVNFFSGQTVIPT